MAETENLGSFFKENKKLVKEWLDARLEIYKLKLIRIISKSAGYFIWIIISLFLSFLFIIFLGLVAGFWLSDLTGSYVIGFGITTLIILLKIILLTVFRKTLFVNPIIRSIIKRANHDEDEMDEEQNADF
jgi:hypothetical protein